MKIAVGTKKPQGGFNKTIVMTESCFDSPSIFVQGG